MRKALNVIEKILFIVMFVSMTGMDSTDVTIPVIGLIASMLGLYIAFRVEDAYVIE